MSSDTLKIRISHGPLTAMGPGKADLLEAIIACGSISAAAKHMGMSYRRAWELVNTMNQCFQGPLVTAVTGGNRGGGAVVTELGQRILKSYKAIVTTTHTAAKSDIEEIIGLLQTQK